MFNSFQSSVSFQIEISELFCKAKQMAGFYMKSDLYNIFDWTELS